MEPPPLQKKTKTKNKRMMQSITWGTYCSPRVAFATISGMRKEEYNSQQQSQDKTLS